MNRAEDPTRWRERATCRLLGPEFFFLDDKQPAEEAILACNICPVLTQCRQFIDRLEAGNKTDLYGYWAGQTPEQRYRRRVQEKRGRSSKPRTECRRGHPFTEENTYTHTGKDGRTSRRCRTCVRQRQAKQNHRRKKQDA